MTRAPGPGLIRRLSRALRGSDRREPGRVNHISLGSHCHTAQILKRTGLRTWSGPFDWIFSSPGMVRDCLADDFAGLLDRAQYESTSPDARPAPHEWSCRHRLYAERHAIPYVFNHHDPATSEADYRFLREGVRRLRTALARKDGENRFYLLTPLLTADETVLGLSGLIAERGARNRLVFLQVMPGSGDASVEVVPSPRPELTWMRVATRSASLGVRFADPQDEILVESVIGRLAREP